MERSVVGHGSPARRAPAIGVVGRARGTGGRKRRAPPARGARGAGIGRARTAINALLRAPGARPALETVRRALAFLARHGRVRIALLAVLIALPLLGGGWLWLRNSSLVAVQHVRISGVHGPEARSIESALRQAAGHMTTLNLHPSALRAAVAPFRVVREVHAVPSFPHGLEIRVVERLPVAALTAGGVRMAVAADGVVLGSALLSPSLPTLEASSVAVAARVSDPHLLAPLAVLGAAPGGLRRYVARAFTGPKGLTLVMRNGLLAYFGDASLPHAKWLSLARVLSDQSSAGASYVDVRVPERPAAGFPAGVAPPAATTSGSGSSAPELPSNSESAVAALEASLAVRNGTAPGESSAATTGTPEAGSAGGGEAAGASEGGGGGGSG
jgi:cell division protein FtsQ